jgi:hypothetical protein
MPAKKHVAERKIAAAKRTLSPYLTEAQEEQLHTGFYSDLCELDRARRLSVQFREE